MTEQERQDELIEILYKYEYVDCGYNDCKYLLIPLAQAILQSKVFEVEVPKKIKIEEECGCGFHCANAISEGKNILIDDLTTSLKNQGFNVKEMK